jgi:Ca2+-binding EF-hand superfamily protein
MKLYLALATSAATVSAFTTNPHRTAAPSSTQMMAENNIDPFKFVGDMVAKFGMKKENSDVAVKTDSSRLVEEAMRITNEHGSHSAAARLAWEAVEEVDSSDNSVASMGNFADECDVENVSQDCLDYNAALEDLQELIAANKIPESSSPIRKELASTVAPVKLSAPQTKAAPQSKELQAALEEARSLTASKGMSSKEAIFAWETVEEIASAGTSNAMGDVLSSEECFVFEEASKEACNALEELSKITDSESTTTVVDKLVTAFSKPEAVDEFRQFFKSLDTNYDNQISGKEWGAKVYANKDIMSKFFGGSTLGEIGEAFNRIDSNGNDMLTWDEFHSEIMSYAAAKQFAKALQTKSGQTELKALFDTLDKDSDGKVTGKEWGSKVYQEQALMSKYFGGSDMASIGKAFNRINANKDEALSWDEFVVQATAYATSV